MKRKRLLLLHIGGTIGMRPGTDGYVPCPGFLEQQLEAMPEFDHPEMPEYRLIEFDPLLDSSNMSPADWLKIADAINQHYQEFDGFVVLHGTDTMAYTASALPLMLRGLGKPVILTGSQIPLCQIRNDARENLVTALIIASHYDVPEVCVYFSGKLIRGCRCTKVSAHDFDAFGSPNYPLLGVAGTSIDINHTAILDKPSQPIPFQVQSLSPPRVGTLRLFPGITVDVVEHFLDQPLQGLVLEAYGSGNGPANNSRLIQLLGQATQRGAIVVAVTQCHHGRVGLKSYATGHALADAGVLSGHDMTVEAALTKLFYLHSISLPADAIRKQVETNLVGELTANP